MALVDNTLPFTQRFFFQNFVNVFLRIGIAAYTVIWVLIIIPFLIFFSAYYLVYFIKGVKEIWRIEQITNSPLIGHLGETIQGMRTIWAFQAQDQFFKKMYQLQERNIWAVIMQKYVMNWFNLRVSLLSVLIMFVSMLLCVLLTGIDQVLIGITMIYISTIQQNLFEAF